MKRAALSLCCWLALCLAVFGEDVRVDANKIVRLKADVTSADDLVFWSVDKEEQVDAEELPGGKLYFAAPPGVYRVKCVVVPVKDGKIAGGQKATRYVVTIGPPGPVPPGPNPPPVPPQPAPIDGPGFRVMVIYETDGLAKLPKGQLDILYAKSVRDYLNAKAAPTADGGKRGWYIVDQNVDFSGESKVWQDAFRRPRAQTPWVIVSDGKTGYEGPLPADVPAMLALLKKYGD
jgi:hypothetical protein